MIALLLLLALPISVPLVNDAAARDIEKELLALPVPKGAEVVESTSQAGKIVGNGNGMQYIGALLVRSDRGIGAVSGHYATVSEDIALGVAVVASAGIERQGFHGADGFLSRPRSGDDLYVAYAFGEGPGAFFESLDLRGR
ncbi:hypothetical protein [Brachybacterium saurashtrense]|uniref:Uncharacterized protein n=1 Tax=Brachybacterium saurashtrense TaxID=556288 RepID=A0A345YRG8_9MICO|nr:hypothetical protein [Brachybacterium saurashtrense]AXK46520.1 hypothetical protein DWV08_13460 [Brachybacterium saurashtrense]RRR24261.1 hypothetical protein DXU92_05210 [Brachybacterium saurashtrense]